jgi:FkbM family methyltransferase
MSDMNHESQWIYEQAKAFLKPGMFAMDIGANTGIPYTKMFFERVAPGGTVWSFEPGPAEFNKLASIEGKNVTFRPFNLALSDEKDVRSVYHYQYWSLIDVGAAPDKEAFAKNTNREFFTCTFDRLDSFELPQKVDLIKIDVDGQEARVLRGAMPILARDKPVIVIELGHFVARYFGENIETMVKTITDLGYAGSCWDMHDLVEPDRIAGRTPDESTIDFIFKPRGT